jgi:hypothetical protein
MVFFAIVPPLVVVGDFRFKGITVFPSETDPPLIVDPDAVLTLPISGELLEAIPGWNSQVAQRIGRVKYEELLQRRPANILRELF